MELNPNIKCIEPDYCYVNYLDGEYKDKNIKIRYSQAVIKEDKPFNENNNIKFMDIPETKCICIYHKGSYDTLGKSYAKKTSIGIPTSEKPMLVLLIERYAV